jgi:hypothetical protein
LDSTLIYTICKIFGNPQKLFPIRYSYIIIVEILYKSMTTDFSKCPLELYHNF